MEKKNRWKIIIYYLNCIPKKKNRSITVSLHCTGSNLNIIVIIVTYCINNNCIRILTIYSSEYLNTNDIQKSIIYALDQPDLDTKIEKNGEND